MQWRPRLRQWVSSQLRWGTASRHTLKSISNQESCSNPHNLKKPPGECTSQHLFSIEVWGEGRATTCCVEPWEPVKELEPQSLLTIHAQMFFPLRGTICSTRRMMSSDSHPLNDQKSTFQIRLYKMHATQCHCISIQLSIFIIFSHKNKSKSNRRSQWTKQT